MSDRYYDGDRRRFSNEARDRTYRGGGGDSYRPSSRYEPGRPRSPPRGPARWDRYEPEDSKEPRRRRNYDDEPLRDYRKPEMPSDPPRRRDRYEEEDSNQHNSEESSHSEGPLYKPNTDVKLSRLPPEVTEQLVREAFSTSYNIRNLTDVRIIRDKMNSASRGFGFITFPTLAEAITFMDNHGPTIMLQYTLNGAQFQSPVDVDYSRDNSNLSKNDWECPECLTTNFGFRHTCFKCSAPRTSAAKRVSLFQRPDGKEHASATPVCPLLIIRDLPSHVDETVLAAGVSKLLREPSANVAGAKGPTKLMSTAIVGARGAKEGSLHRVLLVSDRETGESWCYGFAEFFTKEDAQAAIARYESMHQNFTIGSQKVDVHFSHQPFLPSEDSTVEDRFSFPSMLDQDKRLKYCVDKAFLKVKVIKDAPQQASQQTPGNGAAIEAPLAANPPSLIDNSTTVIKSEKISISLGSKKRKAQTDDAGPSKKLLGGQVDQWKDAQAQLRGDNASDSNSAHDPTSDPATTRGLFIDTEQKKCYLCSRKFETLDKLLEHEKDSELHRDNLGDEEKKAKALKKLGRTAPSVQPPAPTDDNANDDPKPQYFDRAKARRKEEKEERRAERRAERDTSSSKGAALLGKMGWTQGQALGANGTGLAAPIETNLYAAGVGLGADGGKIGDAIEEANKNTKDSGRVYIQNAKEKARERYLQSA